MKDYYNVLGVSAHAEQEVIAAAYKALMRKYHPDSGNPEASTEKCREINEAYEALRSSYNREIYDREMSEFESRQSKSSSQGGVKVSDGHSKPKIYDHTYWFFTLAAIFFILVLSVNWNESSETLAFASDQGPTEQVLQNVEPAPRVDEFEYMQKHLVVDYYKASSLDQLSIEKQWRYRRDYKSMRKLATNGDRYAQNDLGKLYADGLEIPKDMDAATRWFSKAASRGLAEAQFNIGLIFEKGDGVAKDKNLAMIWYEKAASNDDVDAAWRLSELKKDAERRSAAE